MMTIWSNPSSISQRVFTISRATNVFRTQATSYVAFDLSRLSKVTSNPFSPTRQTNCLTIWTTSPYVRKALFASFCMGFMFTNSARLFPHRDNCGFIHSFSFESTTYSTDGLFPASNYRHMISRFIYVLLDLLLVISISMRGVFGKVSTRSFPSVLSNPSCFVRIIY